MHILTSVVTPVTCKFLWMFGKNVPILHVKPWSFDILYACFCHTAVVLCKFVCNYARGLGETPRDLASLPERRVYGYKRLLDTWTVYAIPKRVRCVGSARPIECARCSFKYLWIDIVSGCMWGLRHMLVLSARYSSRASFSLVGLALLYWAC